MSSEREDAEKVWAAISKHDISKIKDILSSKTEEEVKNIIEREVNAIVLTKHNNYRDSLSCLHFAAKKGHADILKVLFRFAGQTDINGDIQSSVLGWCPIHYAVYSGQVQAAKTLIREEVNIDASDNRGYTPLHMAIERGLRSMVALLVHEKCNVNAQDMSRNTALHLCFIVNHGWGPKEQMDVVDYLLSRGAEYNISNSTGDLPLHTAVEQEAPKECIEVICKTMNVHEGIAIPNRLGKIPLHLSKSIEISEVLIEYGGSINRQDSEGFTLLHLRSDDVRIIDILLDKGADTSVTDNKGRLPIHHAVLHKLPDFEAIKSLGESLTSVNTQDEAGDTPLHLACDNAYRQMWVQVEKSGKTKRVLKSVDLKFDPILSWLISKGADLNLRNSKGETALHRALKHKSTSKADILARAGADPTLQDASGMLAMKLNPRWFNKMDKQGTFLSTSQASINSSRGSLTDRPRESWFRRLSREATALFTPRIHLEEVENRRQSPTSDCVINPSSQDSSLLLPPKARPGTPSTVVAAPPPSIQFKDSGRTKTQLNAFRMKREQTLLKQTGPVKALPVNKGESAKDHLSVQSDNADLNSELLTHQLSNLHTEVSDVKELLEELSNESLGIIGTKPEDSLKESQPELLERQMSTLQDEVAEVKQMLEQLDSEVTQKS